MQGFFVQHGPTGYEGGDSSRLPSIRSSPNDFPDESSEEFKLREMQLARN